MSLRDLTIALGMSVDDAQLDAADKKLAMLVRDAKAASANVKEPGGSDSGGEGKGLGLDFDSAKKALMGFLAVGAAKTAFGWLADMASQGAALDDLATKLGVSSDALQQMQFAGEMAGVETESVNAAVGFLQKNIGLAANGSAEAAKSFQELGVAYKNADGSIRDIPDVFADIADAMQNTGSEAEMAGKLVKVFGKQGAALIPVLKDGSKGLRTAYDDFARLGGGMDKDFIKKAAEADDELTRTKFAIKGMASSLAVALIPSLSKGAHWVTSFVGGVRDMTKETKIVHAVLLGLGAAGTVGGIMKLAPHAMKAAKGMKALWEATRAAKSAGSALSTLFSGGLGVVATVAGVALLVALFEDLYQLMNGGESVIGDVLDKLGGAGTAAAFAEQLRDVWDQLSQAFTDILPTLEQVGGTLMEVVSDAIPWLVRGFIQAIKFAGALALGVSAVVVTLKEMIGFLVDAYKILDKGGSLSDIGKAWDKRGGAAGAAIDKAGAGVFGKDQSFVNAKTGEVTTRSVGGIYGDTQNELQAALAQKGIDYKPREMVSFERGKEGAVTAPGQAPGQAPVLAPNVSQAITMNTTVISSDPQAAADAVVKKKNEVANDRAMRDAYNAASGVK